MAFQFFRKHQKLILYTAGIFALVSFSITGAIMAFFRPNKSDDFNGPKLTLPGGKVVSVTYDDWVIAKAGLLRAAGDPSMVLPDIRGPEEDSNLVDRYAALHRLAVEFGVDASYVEVDRAIAQAVSVFGTRGLIESPTQLALRSGYNSLQQYRKVLLEAMRVGTFLRLQTMAADLSDAALAESLLEDEENVTLTVAYLDKKKEEDELREKGISDEELQSWLDGLSEADRIAYQDTNHVSLAAVGLLYDPFDPAEFETELADFELDDAKLQQEYEYRKVTYFKKPAPPTPPASPDGTGDGNTEGQGENAGKDGDDEANGPQENGSQEGSEGDDPAAPQVPAEGTAQKPQPVTPATEEPATEQQQGDEYLPLDQVKDRLTRMLQAEAALDAVRNGPIQEALAAHMEPKIQARNDATVALIEARKALADAEKALAEAPDDAAAEAAVATAKSEVEAKELAETAAAEAMDQHRQAFDFAAEMAKLLAGRTGLVVHRIDPPVPGDGLKDLGDLGTWEDSYVATTMNVDGDVANQVQHTDKAAFYFQVPKVIKTPLKPFAEIKEAATADYFAKKADEVAKTSSEAFEAKLLELAKVELGDKVDEIEAKHKQEADDEFTEWKTGLEADIAKAEKQQGEFSNPNSMIFKKLAQRLTKLRDELGQQDEKRTKLDEAADEAATAEVETAARKVYSQVLAQATSDTEFEIKSVGPYSENLRSRPRFSDAYPADVKFLWGDPTVSAEIAEMEPGEATGLLDDVAGRALYVAVLTDRSPATIADLSRRQILDARQRFVNERLRTTLQQSFTTSALEARWKYEPAISPDETAVKPGQ